MSFLFEMTDFLELSDSFRSLYRFIAYKHCFLGYELLDFCLNITSVATGVVGNIKRKTLSTSGKL